MRPYYEDDACTIYQGDCREILPTLDPVDIAVTSPPYNMGVSPGGNGRGMYGHKTSKASRFTTEGYDGKSDALSPEEYADLIGESSTLTTSVARMGTFWNCRPRLIHGRMTNPLDLVVVADDVVLRQIIVWDRGTGIDVGTTHFCTRQEWIALYVRPSEFALVDHSASGMGDVWRLGMPAEKFGHPCPFPLSLPARCIAATGARSVLDPFAGTGTTLRAAKDVGVRAIGIEESERFCEIAVKRLAQEVLPL